MSMPAKQAEAQIRAGADDPVAFPKGNPMSRYL